MDYNKNKSLAERISKLESNNIFDNPIITPEGYGSFIEISDSLDTMYLKAKHLKAQADTMDSVECIDIYMDSLYQFLKSQALFKNDIKQYASKLRNISKLMDQILIQARKFNCKELKTALKWGIFNVKMHTLFKEADIFNKNKEINCNSYIINEIKNMSILFDSKATKSLNLVEVEDIEYEIKRILSSEKSSH